MIGVGVTATEVAIATTGIGTATIGIGISENGTCTEKTGVGTMWIGAQNKGPHESTLRADLSAADSLNTLFVEMLRCINTGICDTRTCWNC